jgi:hypothetical protein
VSPKEASQAQVERQGQIQKPGLPTLLTAPQSNTGGIPDDSVMGPLTTKYTSEIGRRLINIVHEGYTLNAAA